MSEDKMIVVTGAAGFIGSCLVAHLNNKGLDNLVLVDDFSRKDKVYNLLNKKFRLKVHREQFLEWLEHHYQDIAIIIHLGAKTDTTLHDVHIFKKLNIDYTEDLFDLCTDKSIRLLYASSAATYGNGELGYKDDENLVYQLKPLNPYGVSKNDVDKYIFKSEERPPQYVGLKFFNVYGPNEYHKGRMASVIFHAYNQILSNGQVTLFKSHKEGVADGEQMRDFVYVKDVVAVIDFFMEHPEASGLYNLGTGQARSFKDLALAVFDALGLEPKIKYIDTPLSIRDNYQYFTEADMHKLHSISYQQPFFTLEDGVKDYVKNYLEKATTW